MRTARGWIRTGSDRRRARWGRLPVAAAALVAAVAAPVFAGAAVAQSPGKNGILAWQGRLPTGYQQGDNNINGVGPVSGGKGSGARALFPGFTRAVWSPDGNSALLEKRGFGTGEIYLWTAARGVGSRPIVTAPTGWSGVGEATWSPDGKRFAFTAFDGGNLATQEIWAASADGSNPHRIYDPQGTALLEISWGRTPSGDRIAMVTGCGDPGWKICTFDPNAPAQSRATAVPVPGAGTTEDFAFYTTSLDWSPDGSGKLLVSAHPTVQGGNPTACNGNPCAAGAVCDRVYTNGEIFVVDTQTGGARNLSNTEGLAGPYEARAIWSPDGTEIAYLSAAGGGPVPRTTVWVANYTGGSNPQITNRRMISPPLPPRESSYLENPSWQPCRTPLTKVCTVQAFGSAVGRDKHARP